MSIDTLRQHARVDTRGDEIRIWLPSRAPLVAVSALIVAGSLATELALLLYAREQGGLGAWAILVIVTLWLVVVTLMIRHRLRDIDRHPTLRLTTDALLLGERAIPLTTIRGAHAVEHATYTTVEIETDSATVPVPLGSRQQGAPLAALISARAHNRGTAGLG